MKPSTRVLTFPCSVAVVTALAGCSGLGVNDPSVRTCHGDVVTYRSPSDSSIVIRVIVPEDTTKCRKAA